MIYKDSTVWVRGFMNFLSNSIPRAQGGSLPPQLCVKWGCSSLPAPPKLRRLTHASWEDLSSMQVWEVSQQASGFLPASQAQQDTVSVSHIASFLVCDQTKAWGFSRQPYRARERPGLQPPLHLDLSRVNTSRRHRLWNICPNILDLSFRM